MRRRHFLAGLVAVAAAPRPALAEAADMGVIGPADYYSKVSRARWGAWGPPARTLAPPAGLFDDPRALARRVIQAARRHIGLGYQHHHLPDFDPPSGWPWRPVSADRNGPGLDCSNFTSLAFNQALGIKLPTGIKAQAEATRVAGPGGRGSATLSRIAPASYDEAVESLRPADLLFIRSDAGRVSHVVLWLGPIGDVPSILDCTDAMRRDAGGGSIPAGVQVRPFLPGSWYGRRFAHAHRLDGLGTGTGPVPSFADGGDL